MEFHDVYTTEDAPAILYRICEERSQENIVNISFEMPTWEEHKAFIASHPYAHWFLIFEDWYHGYISLTHRNEIGVVLFKKSRGIGIGKRALEKLVTKYQPLPAVKGQRSSKFLANINPENERSKRLFKGMGFELVQHTYAKS